MIINNNNNPSRSLYRTLFLSITNRIESNRVKSSVGRVRRSSRDWLVSPWLWQLAPPGLGGLASYILPVKMNLGKKKVNDLWNGATCTTTTWPGFTKIEIIDRRLLYGMLWDAHFCFLLSVMDRVDLAEIHGSWTGVGESSTGSLPACWPNHHEREGWRGGGGREKKRLGIQRPILFFKSFLCLLFIYGVYSVIENLDWSYFKNPKSFFLLFVQQR